MASSSSAATPGAQATLQGALGSQRVRSRFFVLAAAWCAVLVFGGFTPTYFGPLLTSSSVDVAPVVHVHGIVFFAWTLLFLVQTTLVGRQQVALHRSVGLLGISLATAVVILGFTVSLRANAERFAAGEMGRAYALGFSNTYALVTFAALFAAAIYMRRKPDFHKRFMLFATTMLLAAPVGRLYRPVFAPAPPPPWIVFATIDTLLVACLAYDWTTRRRVHPATAIAGVVLIASQVLRFGIPGTAWWRATYDAMIQLVG